MKKQTTIILRLEEDICCDYVQAYPPRTGLNAGEMTPARKDLAARFGFDEYITPKALPPADPESTCPSCDIQKLAERIERIAARCGATVSRTSPLRWVIRRTAPVPRPQYEFPKGSFSGCNQTKWGATDFYGQDRATILAAMRSGLDFETPWLSCKKEILSTRISRKGVKTTVKVSVSDDFDTPGMGEASRRIVAHSRISDESILRALEKLGDEAHDKAERDRKCNQDYIGYSVGPDEKPYPWVLTYLVNGGGCNTPSGDNYHWWGWQEVETDEETDEPAPHPPEERIPVDVADKLAEMMEQGISPAVYAGFRATAWK